MKFDSGLTQEGKAYINDNPNLMSLLYDANCMPETVTSTQNPARRATMIIAIVAFALGRDHPDPQNLIDNSKLGE